MKGGIAASMAAMAALAEQRAEWGGEVVLTLAGDEESMARAGPNICWIAFARHGRRHDYRRCRFADGAALR